MSNVGFSQSLLGNKWESCDAPDWMAAGLCELTAELNGARPDESCGGGLGGMDGYGQDFENEVFVMFPYYWGDCSCGYEQREAEWSALNDHRAECYQERVDAEIAASGAKKDKYDMWPREAEDAARKKLCKELGLSYPDGCAVHCTCDYETRWRLFAHENKHAESCPIVRPNFLHKKSGLAVHWYKYIGRGMTANIEISRREWRSILAECIASVVGAA